MKVREKNNQGRKGFTIVELVIVIGVIGVLSAVLIPTFIHLNAKAQTASDQSFVKNANTALGMSGKHDSMREAIAAVQEQAGLDVTTYKPVSGNHLIYDPAADRFAIVDDDAHLVYGDGNLKVSQPGEMLEVTDRFVQGSQKFGIYAGPEWDLSQTVIGTESAPLTVSFDAGEQDNIASDLALHCRISDKECNDTLDLIGTFFIISNLHAVALEHMRDHLNRGRLSVGTGNGNRKLRKL